MMSNVKRVVTMILCMANVVCLTSCTTSINKTTYSTNTVIIAEKNESTSDTTEYYLGKNEVSSKEIDINLNQVGYLPESKKIATIRNNAGKSEFHVLDEEGNDVFKGILSTGYTDDYYNETLYYADFSDLTDEGTYYIMCGDEVSSPIFNISDSVYSHLEQMAFLPFTKTLSTKKEAILFSESKQLDISGGWYTDCEDGLYVVTSCSALANMLYAQTYYQSLMEKVNNRSKEAATETETKCKEEMKWLLKMQDSSSGGVYHKVTPTANQGESLKNQKEDLYVSPVSTCATADFAAIMAIGYQRYQKSDSDFANQCLKASVNAWSYLEEHKENQKFSNPNGIYSDEYSDDSDKDERFWAATELYLATRESKYYESFAEYADSIDEIDFGWKNVSGYAFFDYISGTNAADSTLYVTVKNKLQAEANRLTVEPEHGYLVNPYSSDQNISQIINEAVLLALMDQYQGGDKYYDQRENYFNYMLGENPDSINYFEDIAEENKEMSLEISSAMLIVVNSIMK